MRLARAFPRVLLFALWLPLIVACGGGNPTATTAPSGPVATATSGTGRATVTAAGGARATTTTAATAARGTATTAATATRTTPVAGVTRTATRTATAASPGATRTTAAAPRVTGNRPPVRVGSKDFTEQFIIGEMYALLLEDAGFTVERKLNLGGSPVAQQALESNQIDLYPEYTGTGLVTILKLPASSERQQVFDTVSREYKSRYNLVWLEPAPMNNTQALAMTRQTAQRLGIRTISEMAAQANQLRMVGPAEFEEREDGLPGIQAAYGNFRLRQYIAVDPGLRYQALVSGQADVVVAFGTDGEISANNLVVLEDDRKLFPVYQVAPVVRQQALDVNPEIRQALDRLAPRLTDETMRRLNNEVSGNRREPAAVAREFLTQEGLITRR